MAWQQITGTVTGETGSLVSFLSTNLATLGWTVSYTGASKAAYRQGVGAAGTNRIYLRVDDAGPGAGSFREARCRGYETMTDVDTGLAPIPTVAQAANGLFIRKSASLDAVARTAILIGDQRTFYLLIQAGDTAGWYYVFMFGDIYSFVPNDAWRAAMIGRPGENVSTAGSERFDVLGASTITGHYLNRPKAGTGDPVTMSKAGNANWGSAVLMVGALNVPQPDGGLAIANIEVMEASGVDRRGKLRGCFHWGHTLAAASDGFTTSGAGEYDGKSLVTYKQSPSAGVLVFETSNTVEESE
jgi:hypothetical protein